MHYTPTRPTYFHSFHPTRLGSEDFEEVGYAMDAKLSLEEELTFKQKREQDAFELAQLIYEMFVEEQANASIKNELED